MCQEADEDWKGQEFAQYSYTIKAAQATSRGECQVWNDSRMDWNSRYAFRSALACENPARSRLPVASDMVD